MGECDRLETVRGLQSCENAVGYLENWGLGWYEVGLGLTLLPSLPLLALPAVTAAWKKIYAGKVRIAELESSATAQQPRSFLERTPRKFFATPDSRRFRIARK
jgi:hypothetical protein